MSKKLCAQRTHYSTAEDAEDAEDTEEKTLIQCFETSASSAVNFFLVPAPPGWGLSENNFPVLRRNVVRIQGTAKGA